MPYCEEEHQGAPAAMIARCCGGSEHTPPPPGITQSDQTVSVLGVYKRKNEIGTLLDFWPFVTPDLETLA